MKETQIYTRVITNGVLFLVVVNNGHNSLRNQILKYMFEKIYKKKKYLVILILFFIEIQGYRLKKKGRKVKSSPAF